MSAPVRRQARRHCVQEQAESPTRPCRLPLTLGPGQILGAHSTLCTTRRLGPDGWKGPSAWHPWPHTLVISHLLPQFQALQQMHLPLLWGQHSAWAGSLGSWVLILGKSMAITGSKFFCEVSVPRASPAPCRIWAGSCGGRVCLLATPSH